MSDKINDYLFGLRFYISRKLKGDFKSILESDSRIHNITIPIATYSPRILAGCATSVINTVQCNSYEEFENGRIVQLINAASYHYGGYGTLEYNSIEVLNNIIGRFDLICKNDEDRLLDETVRNEFARYMGYEYCLLTSTGYGMNMTVFHAMKNNSIFVLDSDCHNSMFMGVRSTASKYLKFKHNDMNDLERILKDLNGNVIVCVESLYSMSGSICPLKDIVDLKRKYGFKIYVDEAHSLFTIGNTGRGILEYYGINPQDVDVLGFTLSKSMGGIGGVIVSHEHLEYDYCNDVPMIVKARLLQVIRKTDLMEMRMRNLRAISEYVYDRLSEVGLIINNVRGSPIISIHVGTYRNLSLMVNNTQKEGLAITGAGPPATKDGEAVVRLCLCAIHTEEQIRYIIDKIVELCKRYKIKGYNGNSVEHSRLNINVTYDLSIESDEVDNDIMDLIGHDFPNRNVTCLNKYGLGACSARWLYGTFDIHLKAEKKIANLYGDDMDCMIYSDSRSTILFTIEALIEPLKNKKLTHLVLLPHRMESCINMAKLDKNRVVEVYDPNNISIKSKRCYVTIYVEDQEYIDDIMEQLHKNCKGITLILRDKTYGKKIKKYNNVRTIIVGTFDDIGLQGGYCVSTRNTIEILRWRSRGYFFTASPMPITMDMLCNMDL